MQHLKSASICFFLLIVSACPQSKLTWGSSHPSLQARSSCTDLVCSSLTHGPHSKLKGATRDVLASVLDIDSVGPNFLGDEAHTVGAAPSIHDVSVHCLSTGTGHLSRHGLRATLYWMKQSSTKGAFRCNEVPDNRYSWFKNNLNHLLGKAHRF